LYKIGQSNDKEKRDADSDYIAAARRLTQASARFEMAEHGPRSEVIAQARFDAAAQQALADRLERDWKKTEITAPFDGYVVAKRTEVGQWITAGGPVAEMIAVETVRVRVDVPESAIPFARRGSAATVEIEALQRTIKGKIARVIPRADRTARSFPVEIDLPNPEHALLPGMFVWVRVPSGPEGKRLMVSKDAIVPRGPSKQVYVVRPGQDGGLMAIPMSVTTGMEIGHDIEIAAAGLRAGDRVVCRGNERLHGPTPITISDGPATQPSESSPPSANSKN
ncbi:MAG: efflux RND transporter periplasmic adaptor subunit, partial [Planctomycetes bacterium]|nr:efflux RND transporter periplasmic adaptor subunit [Planctomycetota bacterium]